MSSDRSSLKLMIPSDDFSSLTTHVVPSGGVVPKESE